MSVTTQKSVETTEPPPGTRHLGIALIVIAFAQLMIVLDATIVNIALPRIQRDASQHLSQADQVQWVVTAYALALGSLLLLGGRLGDLFGRRKMFVLGVGIFSIASLLGGLAPTGTLLISARVLQGVGAALAQPAALALINTTFPVGKQRNRAMAVYAAMSGMGAAVGLILGGFLTQTLGWEWTFFINVPIGLAVAIAAPRVLVESEGHDGRLDIPGAVTATAGLFGIVYGLSHAGGHSWGDALSLVPLGLGLALLVVFVIVESRVQHPLLPLRIVADRTRGVSLFAMLIVGAGMFAMFFFLGLFLQQVLGYSPIKSGLAFLPFSAGIVIAAGIATNVVARIDPRWIAGFGGLLATFGMWGFTHLSVDSGYWSHLFPYIVIMSLGMGLVFIPLTLTATAGVRGDDAGAAASALNTMQQVGGAVGIAALTTVFTHAATAHGKVLGAAAAAKAKAAAAAGQTPTSAQVAAGKHQIALHVQTYASSHVYWVAAGMILIGALSLFAFLTVSHEHLQTDGNAAAHVG
ncbi:MFS transporter [Allobranchiibius sp. GilTou38]|uniref:MFS transporter n=1 Tax=Allobranchiibius sp. GilTou38 TaxID=2815210 RepID=UPI001AA1D41A|nr:MFS transporter [Allobranchiibius sp. GilTou38]MBO1765645.1 MFS transporter [Allobranchiibius sp. GilTou38]